MKITQADLFYFNNKTLLTRSDPDIHCGASSATADQRRVELDGTVDWTHTWSELDFLDRYSKSMVF